MKKLKSKRENLASPSLSKLKNSESKETNFPEDDKTHENLPIFNIDTLAGMEWLDDTIINTYGKMLQNQFPERIFVFDSHFLEKLQTSGFEGVKGMG